MTTLFICTFIASLTLIILLVNDQDLKKEMAYSERQICEILNHILDVNLKSIDAMQKCVELLDEIANRKENKQ